MEKKDILVRKINKQNIQLYIVLFDGLLQFQINGVANNEKWHSRISQITDYDLNKYFSSLESFAEYIESQGGQNFVYNESGNILQVVGKHPTKKNEQFLIAQIKLSPGQFANKSQCLAEKIYGKDSQMTSDQLKYILKRMDQQLRGIKQKLNQKKQETQYSSISSLLTKNQLQAEVDVVKEMMVTKLGSVSQSIEKNRNFYMKEIEELKKQIYIKIDEITSNIINSTQNLEEELNKINSKLKEKNSGFNLPYSYSSYSQNSLVFPPQMPPPMGMKSPLTMPWSLSESTTSNTFKPPSTNPLKTNQQKMNTYQNKNLIDRTLYTKIKDLEPGDQQLFIIAKIVNLTKSNRGKYNVVLGDETGIVNGYLTLNNPILIGQTIIIQNGVANVYKEHISINLQRRKGAVKISPSKIHSVNHMNNISNKSWIEDN